MNKQAKVFLRKGRALLYLHNMTQSLYQGGARLFKHEKYILTAELYHPSEVI